MNAMLNLPLAQSDHPAMDYAFLRSEAIRHIERMAGRLWTDYNAHDPGITILEQVCYAITDLGYRISYEIPDILATGGEDPYRSLYSPARILTSHPVTLTDLRKLALDVEGVSNAWIEKVEESEAPFYFHAGKRELSFQEDFPQSEPVFLKGLYRVLIRISEDADSATVRREVARRLHENRGLCEDFEEIRVLDTQSIQLRARIEIGPFDDAEKALLGIYEKISSYLSPSISFSTLGDLLEAGKPVEDIFEGPLLEHGFLDSEALDSLGPRDSIYTSDLIREIMDVEGVRAVKSIRVSADDGTPEKWRLKLDTGKALVLDIHRSEIILEKKELSVGLGMSSLMDTHNGRLARSKNAPKPGKTDFSPPPFRDRKAGKYYSIQHQFPACYGIGTLGLPDSATPERKARAKQLKAYLTFFDQLLADYFAQLAHVKDLFSYFGEDTRTFFSQSIEECVPGLAEILIGEGNPSTGDAAKSFETSEKDSSEERKNRFLNHLLARFAEYFTDYSLMLLGTSSEVGSKLIRVKQEFLQNYPRIGSARGSGFNYLKSRAKDNLSGLEERIRLKLGLEEDEYFHIVEHILLRPMKEDRGQQIPILSNANAKDPYSLQLSFVFPEKIRNREAFIVQTVREETPAHLTPYVHWLDEVSMARFKAAYEGWLDKRRDFWLERLGLEENG